MSLTINQEKQIRGSRRIPVPEGPDLPLYHELAKKVALYRRAQKINTAEGSTVRKELLAEIDVLLQKLGVV